MDKFLKVFQDALSPGDYEFLVESMKTKEFQDFLDSASAMDLAQLTNSVYRDFLRGELD